MIELTKIKTTAIKHSAQIFLQCLLVREICMSFFLRKC